MAENSHISWTDNTFNPWMGCTKVSPACQNCYAERDMDHRYHKVAWGPKGTRVLTSESNWRKPLKWDREAAVAGERRFVFCASLADVFEDWDGPMSLTKNDLRVGCRNCGRMTTAPVIAARFHAAHCQHCSGDSTLFDDLKMHHARRELFALIDATPHLDWLLLTKRPENVERMWSHRSGSPPPGLNGGYRGNVILGTSIENQEWTDKRLPHLHAAKRYGLVSKTFVSAEPLVGPVMLHGNHDGKVYRHLGGEGIDWVITGGESGPNARPCKPEWFRSLRDQAEAAGVAFHFKQWGEFDVNENRVGVKVAGRELDGRTHDGLPRVASV